jgi:hypothetical protein
VAAAQACQLCLAVLKEAHQACSQLSLLLVLLVDAALLLLLL